MCLSVKVLAAASPIAVQLSAKSAAVPDWVWARLAARSAHCRVALWQMCVRNNFAAALPPIAFLRIGQMKLSTQIIAFKNWLKVHLESWRRWKLPREPPWEIILFSSVCQLLWDYIVFINKNNIRTIFWKQPHKFGEKHWLKRWEWWEVAEFGREREFALDGGKDRSAVRVPMGVCWRCHVVGKPGVLR